MPINSSSVGDRSLSLSNNSMSLGDSASIASCSLINCDATAEIREDSLCFDEIMSSKRARPRESSNNRAISLNERPYSSAFFAISHNSLSVIKTIFFFFAYIYGIIREHAYQRITVKKEPSGSFLLIGKTLSIPVRGRRCFPCCRYR